MLKKSFLQNLIQVMLVTVMDYVQKFEDLILFVLLAYTSIFV